MTRCTSFKSTSVIRIAATLLISSCSTSDPEAEFPDDIVYYRREVTVTPGGSETGSRYWAMDWKDKKIQEVTKSGVPQNAEVVTVGPMMLFPLTAQSVLSPSYSLMVDTLIAGLIAGGIEQGVNASRRAAVAMAGQSLETGLNMTVARAEHTMTQLPGERVLIAGGFGLGTAVHTSAEIFTFASRSFAGTGTMRRARGSHAAAALTDGRVLLTGGLTPSGAGPATIDHASTEIFNPATGTFADGPNMSVARFNHSAITLNDGRVLVLGGNGRRSAEVYSPSTNTFSPAGDMAVVHGQGHVALLLPSGKVLVLGGDVGNINPTAVAELFDPVTNTFTRIVDMRTPRMQHFAVVVDDGIVLIGGGRTLNGVSLNTTEIFDPATNSFTASTLLPAAIYDAAAVFVKARN